MLDKKAPKKPGNSTHVLVGKEMAKPRMARSARIAELNLDTAHIPIRPSASMPGTVERIIPSLGSQPENAQIRIYRTEHGYRDFRIENALTDENGDDRDAQKGRSRRGYSHS